MQTANVFSFLTGMNGVKRFSMLKLCHDENVLEHTGMVVILAWLIANKCRALLPDHDEFDIAAVLQRAIVHDFDETITGDVTRPVKYFSKELRAAFKPVEETGINNIVTLLQDESIAFWHANAKEDEEGYVVAYADLMAAIHRVWEEVLVYHNYHLIRPAANMTKVLYKLQERLHSRMPRETWPVFEQLYQELMTILVRVTSLANQNQIVEIHNEGDRT